MIDAPRAHHAAAPFGSPCPHSLRLVSRTPRKALLAGALSLLAPLALLGGCASEDPTASASPDSPGSTGIVEIQDTTADEIAALDPDAVARKQAAEQARAELDAALAAIEASGANISCIALDLVGDGVIEHDADRVYYSASSIKGPFCVGLARSQGDDARSRYGDLITATVVDSSNEAYEALRERVAGQPVLKNLFREAGVERDAGHWYTDYSVRDLAAIWRVCAQWLSSDDQNARWLGGLLGDSLNSRVDDVAVGEQVVTWSKAGWFSGEERYDVTFDGGVIKTSRGAYAIAVATDRGSDFKAIESVMRPLAALAEAEFPSARP